MKKGSNGALVQLLLWAWASGALALVHTWLLPPAAFEGSLLPLHLALIFLLGALGFSALAGLRMMRSQQGSRAAIGCCRPRMLTACWLLSWFGPLLLSLLVGFTGDGRVHAERFVLFGWIVLLAGVLVSWLRCRRMFAEV